MKFLWPVVIVVVSLSFGGWAQQNSTFKVKKTPEDKPPRSVPITKAAGPNASSANAKSLQSVEHEKSVPAHSAAKKTGTSTLKPVKDKPNPPINFGGTGGGKQVGMVNQGPNPYKGRLKQKHAQQ
jgi:hypothetical protein